MVILGLVPLFPFTSFFPLRSVYFFFLGNIKYPRCLFLKSWFPQLVLIIIFFPLTLKFISDRFAETIDLDVTDPVAHKHIPYVVILVKMAQDWAKSHGGSLPSTREEKKQFKVYCLILFCVLLISILTSRICKLILLQMF